MASNRDLFGGGDSPGFNASSGTGDDPFRVPDFPAAFGRVAGSFVLLSVQAGVLAQPGAITPSLAALVTGEARGWQFTLQPGTLRVLVSLGAFANAASNYAETAANDDGALRSEAMVQEILLRLARRAKQCAGMVGQHEQAVVASAACARRSAVALPLPLSELARHWGADWESVARSLVERLETAVSEAVGGRLADFDLEARVLALPAEAGSLALAGWMGPKPAGNALPEIAVPFPRLAASLRDMSASSMTEIQTLLCRGHLVRFATLLERHAAALADLSKLWFQIAARCTAGQDASSTLLARVSEAGAAWRRRHTLVSRLLTALAQSPATEEPTPEQ